MQGNERAPQTIRTSPFEPHRLERDVKYHRIYLIRSSGLGDLLLMTPMLQAMRRMWPGSEIRFLTSWRGEILDGLVEWEMLPFDEVALTPEDILVDFEDFDLFDLGVRDQHCVDFLAGIAGIRLQPEDWRLLYHLRESELAEAEARFPRSQKPRIGLHFISVRSKSWPMRSVLELTRRLGDKGCEVFWFASPGQVNSPADVSVTNLSAAEPSVGIRESAAILKTCDVVVSVDSVVTHLCSALEIPNVALFGSFPAWCYVTGDRVEVLEGRGACAPCFHYSTETMPWPVDGPCRKAGHCVVLDSIEVDSVLERVWMELGGVR